MAKEIFDYIFDWSKLLKKASNNKVKDTCCEKYKKKGKKKCKSCPNR